MAQGANSTDRLWLAFAVCSTVCLVVLAISPFKDYFRECRRHQNEYRRLLLTRAETKKELRAAEAMQVAVHQIWLPRLGNRVDRCTTCHLGLENPAMADAPQPFRSHPVVPHAPEGFSRFGCVVCHGGQGRATTRDEAHGETPGWPRPLLPVSYTEASCGRCHRGIEVPEASLLTLGRQLMARAGCLGCHEIEGAPPWSSPAPDLGGLREKTDAGWIRAWLTNPQRLRPGTWMPTFDLSTDEVEALVAFLWTLPPRVSLDGLPKPDVGDYDRGRKLFRESRCISCHTVGGRGNGSASELSGVGSKVNARWLVTFLEDPHAFQPATPMPRYGFTHQDAIDLAAYMMEEFVDPETPDRDPDYLPVERLAKEGEKLFRRYGCGGCHRIAEEDRPSPIGPELTGIGDKPVELLDFGRREDLPRSLPAWLEAKLRDPRSFREGLRMPVFNLNDAQVQALVTALLSLGAADIPEEYLQEVPMAAYEPPGRFGRLVQRYRCMSCHRIQGYGGDISTAPLTIEGSRVRESWLQKYLLVPTTIRPLLTDRMVPLRMSKDEAGFLASFMANVYVNDSIPDDVFPAGIPAERVDRGRRLFHEHYGCRACHAIEGSGGYYGPLLEGLGDRLRSGFVMWWLEGPQRWRQDARCPDYGMQAEDARDLAAYIVARARAAEEEAERP